MASSAFYSYRKLAQSTSNYAKRMNRLSNRIFGEVTRPTDKPSMKVVTLFSENPIEQRTEIVNYYPPHPVIYDLVAQLRKFGLYRDEHLDFKDEMKRLRILRGKGPPERGKGKRTKATK